MDRVERRASEARVVEVRVLEQDERRDLVPRLVTLVAVAKDHVEPGSMERDDGAPKPSFIEGHVHGRVPEADAVHDAARDDGPLRGRAPCRSRQLWLAAWGAGAQTRGGNGASEPEGRTGGGVVTSLSPPPILGKVRVGRPSSQGERGHIPRPYPFPPETHTTLVARRPLAPADQGWPVGLMLRLSEQGCTDSLPSAIALRGCAVVAGDHHAACDERAGRPQWGWPTPPARSMLAPRALPLDLCALCAAGVPTGRAWREVRHTNAARAQAGPACTAPLTPAACGRRTGAL